MTDPPLVLEDEIVSLGDFASAITPAGPDHRRSADNLAAELRMLRRRGGAFPPQRAERGRAALFALGDLLTWYEQHRGLPRAPVPAAAWWLDRAVHAAQRSYGNEAVRRFAVGAVLAWTLAAARGTRDAECGAGELSYRLDDLLALAESLAGTEPFRVPVCAPLVHGLALESRKDAGPANRLLQTMASVVAEGGTLAAVLEQVVSPEAGVTSPLATTTTPDTLARLIVAAADPRPGERIVDPAAGEGGLLLAALRQAGGRCELSGRELNEGAWRVATARLYVHGLAVDMGDGPSDSLQDPMEPADVVIVDPPFRSAERGPHRGFLRQWLELSLRLVSDGGRLCISLPARTLAAGRIEHRALEGWHVEAVVAGPSRLRSDDPESVAVLCVARSNGSGRTLFADVAGHAERRESRNVIEPKWTRALGEELRRWRKEDVAPASVATRVVHSSDVLAAGGDLRVERWLERDDEDVGEAIALAQSHTQALLDLIGDRLAPLSTGELERALKRLQARLHAIDD